MNEVIGTKIVKVYAPKDCTEISINRRTYKPPKNGKPMEVTEEVALELKSHGFTDTPPADAKE